MLTMAKGVNAALMFFLELGVLFAAGYWGFTVSEHVALRLLAGLGAPALFIAVWAVFGAANNPPVPLTGAARVVLEVLWFGGGAAALVASGLVTTGTVFAALYVVNAVLRLVWHQV
ncbi:hypothetical protein Pth03_33720 [Planotetraspora thailandica]|uniref:DUF2568 domain-containing protein n=1 Tax=Planotetraspora thailandica TaxID=487172 RepID=A0A8J3V1B0_9ACTN|nr:YrdB family protein [Planotetraspora thailandica]GII54983.1 hypothetical protein Pth03_33720 [Planotetraspora thailandica]